MQPKVNCTPKISASILSCNILDIGKCIAALECAKIDFIHVDVMDGIFVRQITFGQNLVRAIKSITDIKIDVHLMVDQPQNKVEEFLECGADVITIHPESAQQVNYISGMVHRYGRLFGIATRPGFCVNVSYLDAVDMVNVMTVEPGMSGQSFIEQELEKIQLVRSCELLKSNALICVDGGINAETAPIALNKGANMLVSGSFLFRDGLNGIGCAANTLRQIF